MDLFWDIQEMQSGRSGPHAQPSTPESRMRDLEQRVDRLSMICCAMWTVIQSTVDVSDEKLAQLVQDIDLADGTVDGKAHVEQVRPCAKCQRPVHARHQRCIYCGADASTSSPFDAVL